LSNAYSPANLGQESYAVGDIFELDTTTTRVVGKIKKEGPFLHRLQAAKPVESQDLKNKDTPDGQILLAPKVFNIFRGSTWTPKRRNLVDNFATNVAKTDYWKILRTQTDGPTGKSCADLEFKGSTWDSIAIGLIDIDPNVNDNKECEDWVTGVFQSYVTAKKVQTAGDFDLHNFDLANTIFTLYLGPGYSFLTDPIYCGWHSPILVKYDDADPGTKIYISFVLATGMSGCNLFGGKTVVRVAPRISVPPRQTMSKSLFFLALVFRLCLSLRVTSSLH
jgi:hypothetical protein